MGGQSKAWTSFNPLHCGAVVASRNSVSCSGVRSICFNPLHCGAVVASRWRRAGRRRSAQVSIPFIAGQWSLRGDAQSRCVRRARVSIPFIAGQWSLQAELAAAALLLRIGFNPLHCGAVVASFWLSLHSLDRIHVSIPFIAGQWSLRVVIMAMTDGEARFQSPSLRGSGRFRAPARTSARPVSSFNPLHCGAVVASWTWGVRHANQFRNKFQSPSLRGSGRFVGRAAAGGGGATMFQSPSLRGSGRFTICWSRRSRGSFSFNPLHCGAVVASCELANSYGNADI